MGHHPNEPLGSMRTSWLVTVAVYAVSHNKQLQRTVVRRRVRGASASFSLCTCAALVRAARGR
jgi:hypothetical protein